MIVAWTGRGEHFSRLPRRSERLGFQSEGHRPMNYVLLPSIPHSRFRKPFLSRIALGLFAWQLAQLSFAFRGRARH